MGSKKEPLSQSYVKEHNAFLKAGSLIFGALAAGMIAVVVVLEFMQKDIDGWRLVTMALILLIWSTLSQHRLASLNENRRILEAIDELRGQRTTDDASS